MLIFDLRSIGDNLLAARKRTGMTQSEVAAAAGLSDRTYADIERGNVNMRIETVLRVCEALRITPDEILTYTQDSSLDEDAVLLMERLKECPKKQQAGAWKILKAYLDALQV